MDEGGSGWILAVLAALALGCYVYMGATLQVIARKTGTPNGWLAWLPPLNAILLCQVARKPLWWLVLLLVPGVNLVVAVLLWVAVAEQRGRPGWQGGLIVVPLVGLVVPALLAAGEAAPGGGGAPSPSGRRCTKCRALSNDPGDFCGDCGGPLEKAGGGGGGCLVAGAVAAVACLAVVAGGVFLLTRGGPETPPDRRQPALPPGLAGTLTEFPVDPAPGKPGRPTSVVSRTLEPGKTVELPPQTLPPEIPPAQLASRGGALTTSRFRQEPDGPAVAATVVQTPGGGGRQAVDEVAWSARQMTGAQRSPVQVQARDGRIYRGEKISSNDGLVYVFTNPEGTVLIVIYTDDPAARPMADRMATTVGNGRGLEVYPEVRDTVWTLPPSNPAGLVLVDLVSFTREEMDQGLTEAAGSEGDAQFQEVLRQIRLVLPERLVIATFHDPAGQEWVAAVADYGSTQRAWSLFEAFRWSLGLAFRTVDLGEGSGVQMGDPTGAALGFQKGPCLVILAAPPGQEATLATWAVGFQL